MSDIAILQQRLVSTCIVLSQAEPTRHVPLTLPTLFLERKTAQNRNPKFLSALNAYFGRKFLLIGGDAGHTRHSASPIVELQARASIFDSDRLLLRNATVRFRIVLSRSKRDCDDKTHLM